MKEEEKIYYFKELELAVLLTVCGVEELYGFPVSYKEADDKELIRCIHGLVKKGICREEGGKLVVLEDVAGWIEKLRISRTVVRMMTDREHGRICLAYTAKDGLVMMEKQFEEFRLWWEPFDGLLTWMEECGLAPERAEETAAQADRICQMDPGVQKELEKLEEQGPDCSADLSQLERMENRISSFDVISAGMGFTETRYLIVRGSIYPYLLTCGRDGKRAEVYAKETWDQIIRNFHSEGDVLI